MNAQTKSTAPRPAECAVFELRQYTLHPRARETLIELFEREFVDSQEDCGASVVGTFRDLDDPDRFVWLRGFADMPARRQALADFYGGPVWKAHRDAANATMIDSDDVLLLRPAWAGSGFDLDPCLRPAHGRDEAAQSLVIARIYPFDAPVRADFIDWFRRRAMPLFETLGAQTVAALATEEATNDFTALPVREGEHVFAWFAHFGGHAAYARFFEAVTHARRWNDELLPELQRRVGGKPPLLRLAPTARSLLR